MTVLSPGPGFAAVIGDIIESRRQPSRSLLQARLRQALEVVNRNVVGAQPLTITLGDEFQGLYREVGTALRATLMVRLFLNDDVSVRFGVGWGLLETYQGVSAPFAQDGPAWWAARDAIDLQRQISDSRESPRGLRTVFVSYGADTKRGAKKSLDRLTQLSLPGTEQSLPEPGELPAEPDPFVNAFLVCRDELVNRMDSRDVRLVLATLQGLSQKEIAQSEGITQSAVSQRLVRNGGYAALTSQSLMDALST